MRGDAELRLFGDRRITRGHGGRVRKRMDPYAAFR